MSETVYQLTAKEIRDLAMWNLSLRDFLHKKFPEAFQIETRTTEIDIIARTGHTNENQTEGITCMANIPSDAFEIRLQYSVYKR